MDSIVYSRFHHRIDLDLRTFAPHMDSLIGVDTSVTRMRFRRIKASHRGLSGFAELRELYAFCVDQDFVREIARLPRLESLWISECSATDLASLRDCRTLRHVSIRSATKVPSFDWVADMTQLISLHVEHFKLASDLSPFSGLTGLHALGIEGDMWTTQRADSFAHLSSLVGLHALYLQNCRPSRDGIRPLEQLRNLKDLEIAAFYSEAEFAALRAALPVLRCTWFDLIAQHGTIAEAIRSRRKP